MRASPSSQNGRRQWTWCLAASRLERYVYVRKCDGCCTHVPRPPRVLNVVSKGVKHCFMFSPRSYERSFQNSSSRQSWCLCLCLSLPLQNSSLEARMSGVQRCEHGIEKSDAWLYVFSSLRRSFQTPLIQDAMVFVCVSLALKTPTAIWSMVRVAALRRCMG